MAIRASGVRFVLGGALRIALRVYFRSIHVRDLERVPATGAVLLVANHPNSLLDPAILTTLVPRPIHFGAKHTLFKGALGVILEDFGAIPIVRAQDDPRATGRNAGAFKRFEALLLDGRVTAIFPEGLTQDAPHLAPVKSGAARIALQAEAAREFQLGLAIVPVGLQFEPRRRFRGDAFVRFGEPISMTDLRLRYADDPRRATRELTEEIAARLKRVSYHVEAADRIPFAERLVEVYLGPARRTGIAGVKGAAVRGELKQKAAACLNHYMEADPDAVKEIEQALARYEHLLAEAGVDRRLLERSVHLLPGPFGVLQACAEALLGAGPALFGLATGAAPYYASRHIARFATRRERNVAALSLSHILAGLVLFPLAYGLEAWWVWRNFSGVTTVAFALLLVPTGLFARAWMRRVRILAAHIGGRIGSWARVGRVARAAAARRHLVRLLERIRARYRVEVLGRGAAHEA